MNAAGTWLSSYSTSMRRMGRVVSSEEAPIFDRKWGSAPRLACVVDSQQEAFGTEILLCLLNKELSLD